MDGQRFWLCWGICGALICGLLAWEHALLPWFSGALLHAVLAALVIAYWWLLAEWLAPYWSALVRILPGLQPVAQFLQGPMRWLLAAAWSLMTLTLGPAFIMADQQSVWLEGLVFLTPFFLLLPLADVAEALPAEGDAETVRQDLFGQGVWLTLLPAVVIALGLFASHVKLYHFLLAMALIWGVLGLWLGRPWKK